MASQMRCVASWMGCAASQMVGVASQMVGVASQMVGVASRMAGVASQSTFFSYCTAALDLHHILLKLYMKYCYHQLAKCKQQH